MSHWGVVAGFGSGLVFFLKVMLAAYGGEANVVVGHFSDALGGQAVEALQRLEGELSSSRATDLSKSDIDATWIDRPAIENLFGRRLDESVKPQIAVAAVDRDTLLVIGDTLDLSGVQVSTQPTGARDIIIIARRILIDKGDAGFVLQGRRDGGRLILAAIEKFEGSGKLEVHSNGKNDDVSEKCLANVPKWEAMAATMGLLDCFFPPGTSSADLAPNHVFNAQPGSGGYLKLFSKTGRFPVLQFESIAGVGTSCGIRNINACTFRRTNLRGQAGSAQQTDDQNELIASVQSDSVWMWRYSFIQSLETEAQEAVRAKDIAELIHIFKTYSGLPYLPVPPERQGAQAALLGRMNKLRSELLPPVWSRTAQIQQAGLPLQPVLLLTEREDFITRMAPTTTLIQPDMIGGTLRLGLVEAEADRPDLVRFSFNAQLTADPYLLDLVNQKIDRPGERAMGTFANWDLTARIENIPGVQLDRTTTNVSGNLLKASVVVRGDQANLFLWKLGTPAGIHFDLGWSYTGPEGQKISGPGFGATVSALRRQQAVVEVRPAGLVNLGSKPASVSYVLKKDGHAEPLSPQPFIVPALGSIPLPGTLAAIDGLTVPAEAVEFVGSNPFDAADEFYQVRNQNLFQRFTMISNMPSFDADRGGAMRFVDVHLEATEIGGPEAWQDVGTYHLASAGAQGSQINVSVFHVPDKQMRLRVSGTAYYENSSHSDLVPFETTDSSIIISPQNLKGPG